MDFPRSPEETTNAGERELELVQAGFRYALSLVHRHQDAEDLTQDAWLKLCRRYGGVSSQAALFTTIRNLFIDRCRRAKVIAFESWDDAPPKGRAEIAETCAPGTQHDLAALLGNLRPAEREAIFLHHVHGHTAEEIAVLTAQPRGTVLSLLHRALQKLRAAVASPRPANISGTGAITSATDSSFP